MKDNNKENFKNESVLKEALLEYEQVLKAAKSKLVENNKAELDSLIQKFLQENVNTSEPVVAENKESKKDKVQESTMVQKPIGETQEVVGVSAPNTINMKEASLAEVEAAFDSAQPEDEFQVVRDDASQQAPVMGAADQQQLPVDGGDNFDLTSIEGEIDEMMKEINQVEQMQAQQAAAAQPQQQAVVQQPSNNPIDRFKQIHEEMGKYLKEIDEMNENQQLMEEFHSKMSEMYGETYKAQMEESKVNELFDMYKKTKSGAAKPAAPVQEEVAPAAESAEKPVDEAHGVSLSHNKLAGQESQPRLDNGKGYAENKVRLALQKESIEKKMSAMLKENMNLMKQLNTAKAELAEAKSSLTEATKKANAVTSLNENYKGALEKYRDQLKEMAVLNTNISYVNNLLVNENFALSQTDKQNIIEKFKKIGSINESEKVYKETLKEFTETKKETLTESIEEKIASTNVIVESSSANVIEESMNGQDAQVSKMLKLAGVTQKKSLM